MTTPFRSPRSPAQFVALAAALAWSAGTPAATRPVDEHRPADPQGQVEISNVAGSVEVAGWDKPEVAVGGTIGSDVERVEVAGSGSRTTVRVIVPESRRSHLGWNIGGPGPDEVKLVVHVPARSSLTTSFVSSDLKVTGVSGNQELQTVSGDITATAQHELRVHAVSGDVHLAAGPESRLIEISTVSGDVKLAGGAGDVTVSTVSGDGELALGTLTRAHLKTVSGDFTVRGDLAADGRIEAESVSGDIGITFTGAIPPAAFDLRSFSGDLSVCFGPKPASEGYGPGSRLSFQQGTGSAKVWVDTKSGDVTICNRK